MIKSKSNSSRVEWAPKHFSWSLCDHQKMSIKVEEIPPGGKSDIHLHQSFCQFFFILEGKADFRKEDSTYHLDKYEGIEVISGEKHQIKNPGKDKLMFLLINYPPPK